MRLGMWVSSMRWAVSLVILAALLLNPYAASSLDAGGNCTHNQVGLVPFNEPGGVGLYPDGTNQPSSYQDQIDEANLQIVARDAAGAPDVGGKIVLLSVGMSSEYQEFGVFQQVVRNDLQKKPNLVTVNGAQGMWDITRTNMYPDQYWATVAARLANNGVTAQQVEVIWLKQEIYKASGTQDEFVANLTNDLVVLLADIQTRFPNVHLIYLTSRSYGGYQTGFTDPEPYAYWNGFSYKNLISLQQSGDERLLGIATMLWGFYLWADGVNVRSDGWSAPCNFYEGDGLHPSGIMETQLAYRTRDWLRSHTSSAWYRI